MRKRRFFALLCALLLLLALTACKKDETQDPSADGGTPSAPTTPENGDLSTGEYPFSLRFEYNGTGFDTASGTLFTPGGSTARNFTNDLTALRDRLDECNAYEIGRTKSDLTYQTLSGGALPTGDTTLYTISFTADGNSATITIDQAAINTYAKTDSNVSNIGALVDSLISLTALWNDTFS